MWTYWYLQEGEVDVDPAVFVTADGRSSPVLHVDSDQPLRDDAGRLLTTEPWGVYFKPDRTTVQGGAQPLTVGPEFEVDPYPTGSVEPGFPDMWSAALSHCLERFEGCARSSAASARAASGRSPSTTSRARLHAPERVRRRRLKPRLQDDRRRPRGRPGPAEASTPACCTRSATSASRPGTCTRSRTARTPGANRRRARQAAPDLAGGSPQRPLERPPLGRRQAARRPLQPMIATSSSPRPITAPPSPRVGLALADRLGNSALATRASSRTRASGSVIVRSV